MKKTININLGGQPFIIDEQAFDILHRYFEKLKQKFTNENEQKEILADIEDRVGEVFTQRLGKSRAVVDEEDVIYIISLMGRPEDIAGETDGPAAGQETRTTTSSSAAYTGPAEKKFFRDPDNKKVGGVISGLCHYFGWGDPTWIRIVIVALIVLSLFAKLGLGLPLAVIYLILLIVVPEATTSAEKLQMRGQPVTIQNIEKEVRDAMTTAGHSVNSLMKDETTRGRVLSALLTVIRIFAKVFSVILLLICIGFMLALLSLFFGLSFLTEVSLSDMAHMLVSSEALIILAYTGIFLSISIPLISVMYDVIRFLANSKVNNPSFKRALWAIWIASVIMLFFVAMLIVKTFNAADTSKEKLILTPPASGTLRVELLNTGGHQFFRNHNGDDDDDFADEIFQNDLFYKTEYGYAFGAMRMEVAVSPDSNYYVEKVSFSRGSNLEDADKNIRIIKYKFAQSGDTLSLDNKIELPKSAKWRGQKLKVRIFVPEGGQISFSKDIDRIETSVKGNDYIDDGMLSGKTLHVEDGKIKCLDCKEKVMKDEDSEGPDQPDKPDSPDAPDPAPKAPHLSVDINANGVSVVGKGDKNEKIDIHINDKGIKVNTIDSNGKGIVTKK